jgi:hypothetical protein
MTGLCSNCKRSLSEGGTPPRFLIIDDGWQQIENKAKEDANAVVQEGAQYELSFSISHRHARTHTWRPPKCP